MSWGRNFKGHHRHLFLAMVWNKGGRNLVLSEERNQSVKRIFFLDGFEAGSWWHTMKAIFELTNTPMKNPYLKSSYHVASTMVSLQSKFESRHFSFNCPNCKHLYRFNLPVAEKRSYTEVLGSVCINPKQVKKK